MIKEGSIIKALISVGDGVDQDELYKVSSIDKYGDVILTNGYGLGQNEYQLVCQ